VSRAEDRGEVEVLFDEWGEAEWERLASDVRGRVSFEIHRRFLHRFIDPGMRVLEIGAGPGRFTISLTELGGRVFVTDLSAVQLRLNEEHVRAAGADGGVEARARVDVCDLSRFSDGEFDAVVAYGGPLSYVFEDAPDAMAECLRVTRTGGVVLASVMSLVGSARHFLDLFLHDIDVVGLDGFSDFLRHGDQRAIAAAGAHQCRLFSWADVQQLVSGAGGRLIAGSASNWLSLGSEATLQTFERDPALWVRFLDWEERFCQEPGALDGGTHLLFAAERT
jgi:SAM-dependent methyltransferase